MGTLLLPADGQKKTLTTNQVYSWKSLEKEKSCPDDYNHPLKPLSEICQACHRPSPDARLC